MVELLLCAVGAFYAFAGYVATRAALTSHFMDRAIAAIASDKPSVDDVVRTVWFLAAATIVFAGGVALLFLLDGAKWLFLASSVGQALYIFVVAPRYFDVVDPPEPRGRRQTINAFSLYLAATAFVVWASEAGRLKAWRELGWSIAFPLAAAGAHLIYMAWTLKGSPATTARNRAPSMFGNGPSRGRQAQAQAQDQDPSLSKRIKIMADYDCYPTWSLDEETYGDFPPEALGLSPELIRDLEDWADAYSASLNRDNPSDSFWNEEQFAAHDAKARPLAARVARERPDLMIYVMDRTVGVVEVRADDQPLLGGAAS